MSVVGPCCRCITYPSLNIQLSFIHASNAKCLGATKDLGCVLLLSLVYVFIKRTLSPNPPIIKKWKCPEGDYTGKRLWFYFEITRSIHAYCKLELCQIKWYMGFLCFVLCLYISNVTPLIVPWKPGTWLVPLTHHPCFSPSEKLRQKQNVPHGSCTNEKFQEWLCPWD